MWIYECVMLHFFLLYWAEKKEKSLCLKKKLHERFLSKHKHTLFVSMFSQYESELSEEERVCLCENTKGETRLHS